MTRPIRRSRAGAASLAALAVSAGLLSGCDAVEDAVPGLEEKADAAAQTPDGPEARFQLNVRKSDVPVDRILQVKAKHATIKSVEVRSAEGNIPGKVRKNRQVWVAGERLEPGTTYTVTSKGRAADGSAVQQRRQFTTRSLALSEQTYAAIAPLDGETVGVGMPVIVNFDVAVTDRAAFEKHMHVATTPAQTGSWHWISDHQVHWRPETYWQAGTDVTVDLDINGVHAGEGIYGQHDRTVNFHVGDANIYEVNAQTHTMEVYSNGSLLRTIPITTGKAGFITRSGVKVIMEKYRSKRMNSETVGIPTDSDEGYDLDNVEYAMRLTSSGEFIHAAPWSVGSQGSANVSHGCTGMSTADAGWLYSMTRRGDVVEYVGTDRPMEPYNGYGDWNIPFPDYRADSALS